MVVTCNLSLASVFLTTSFNYLSPQNDTINIRNVFCLHSLYEYTTLWYKICIKQVVNIDSLVVQLLWTFGMVLCTPQLCPVTFSLWSLNFPWSSRHSLDRQQALSEYLGKWITHLYHHLTNNIIVSVWNLFLKQTYTRLVMIFRCRQNVFVNVFGRR